MALSIVHSGGDVKGTSTCFHKYDDVFTRTLSPFENGADKSLGGFLVWSAAACCRPSMRTDAAPWYSPGKGRGTVSRIIETIRIEKPVDYATMLTRQRDRHGAVRTGRAPNTLFLLEHEPVITLGRNAHREHVLFDEDELTRRGIALTETDRGGDVTYHGPGQLVAYPILDLRHWRCSVGWYLRTLEEAVIRTLDDYGLKGERVEGLTGVWVDGAKVAAIGVGVRDWVTFHGTAINVDPDMTHFEAIIPCGITNKPVTSLRRLLGNAPPIAEVGEGFEEAFRLAFE